MKQSTIRGINYMAAHPSSVYNGNGQDAEKVGQLTDEKKLFLQVSIAVILSGALILLFYKWK